MLHFRDVLGNSAYKWTAFARRKLQNIFMSCHKKAVVNKFFWKCVKSSTFIESELILSPKSESPVDVTSMCAFMEVKLRGKISPGHAIVICLFNFGTISRSVPRPDLLTRRKEPPYQWNSRPGRPQSQSGSLRDGKPLCPLQSFELLNVQSIAQALYNVHSAGCMTSGLRNEQWYCTLRLLRSRCRHVAYASTLHGGT